MLIKILSFFYREIYWKPIKIYFFKKKIFKRELRCEFCDDSSLYLHTTIAYKSENGFFKEKLYAESSVMKKLKKTSL